MSEEVTKKILKEMEQMSKGGEGSGKKGHKTEESTPTMEQIKNRLKYMPHPNQLKHKSPGVL